MWPHRRHLRSSQTVSAPRATMISDPPGWAFCRITEASRTHCEAVRPTATRAFSLSTRPCPIVPLPDREAQMGGSGGFHKAGRLVIHAYV